MILFNYSSTAPSTLATVSVAEPVTVEIQATVNGRRPNTTIPLKVTLKLDGTEISSAENNGPSATDLSVAAEASIGMVPGKQYKLEVVATIPPNGYLRNISLKGTIVGQARVEAAPLSDTRAKSRKK